MNILNQLALGFSVAASPTNLLFCFIGCLLGSLIGVLPGIGPVTGIALLIPITYGLDPTTAIITMAGVYYGAMYGGSTTSILLNVPGENASVITCLDGYALARQGRAGAALGMAAISSFIAGTFSIVALNLIAEPLANLAVSFGPPEYFALTLLGLTLVTSLTGRSMLKGIISAVFGLLVACVGIDAISGAGRFTFGSIHLLDGIGFIGVAVGLFAMSEVMVNVEAPIGRAFVEAKLTLKSLLPTWQEMKDCLPVFGRCTVLGFGAGVLPGAGATIASFLSYALEKKVNKHRDRFGTGAIEGVAAPEGANNAASGGALVPLLTLGIPGSGSTAVMLGALLMHGLRPGPLLFQTHPEFVWGFIASMYIGNVMLLILNMPLIGMWVNLLRIPYNILMPAIVVLSAVGVYATDNSLTDVWIMAAFGIIGYLMRKLDFPQAPVVLGLVLGPMVERSLRQALTMSHGSLGIFFASPIAATLTILSLLSLFTPVLRAVWKKAGSPEMS